MRVIPPETGKEFILEFDTSDEYQHFFELADQHGFFLLEGPSLSKTAIFRAYCKGSPRSRKIRPLQICEQKKGAFRIEIPRSESRQTSPPPLDSSKGSAPDSVSERLRLLTVNEKAMLALKADFMERRLLMQENNLKINEFLLRNPRLSEQEVGWMSRNPSVPMQTLIAIAKHESWMKLRSIRTAVLMNPKSPSAMVAELIPSASAGDLVKLHHSSDLREDVRCTVTKEIRKRGINPKRIME